ncbi:alpha/beta-hydrolase, partial [Auricularia subglabra TFB-10046 SS5]
TCGVPCDALPGFLPTASSGDGDIEQFWFVGFHPPLNSVIIVHQGSNFTLLFPLLTDLNFIPAPLNTTLFPGVPTNILVHDGFRRQQQRTSARILAAVKSTLAAHPAASVTCTGHSLGAALSLLDAVFLRSQLPSTTDVKFIGFGAPRVGNQAFANHVDAVLGDFTRINNKQDPVPKVPPRLFGFRHPSGEIHISADDQWLVCPGQDSTAVGCINDTERTLLDAIPSNHDGPYDGIVLNGTCG